MAHHLARFASRGAESHAVGDRVESRFQKLQQTIAGHALRACRFLVGIAELALEQPVDVPHLLLFAQLLAVIGHARAAFLAVLAGRVRAALDRAFVGEAFLAFQE